MFSNILSPSGFKVRVIALYSFLAFYMVAVLVILIDRAVTFPVLFSLASLSFLFGLKHALDADHIAAIDNTTRKLINDGKKPSGVGFFFSVGHSLSVFILTVATVIAGKFVVKAYPGFSRIADIVGTGVSAFFLYIIAFMNIVILISIIKIARDFRSRRMEEELLKRGFMFRYFNGIMKLMNSSWQMFFVGLLFGIGFDTASEVAILSMSAVFASEGRPLLDVMVLPLVFSTGMILLDSTDGIIIQYAYGWAFLNPVRKIFYNISITSISVFLALGIGTLEWLQVIGMRYNLRGQPWDFFSNVSFSALGGIIVIVLTSAWLLSMFVYKLSGVEKKYYNTDIE